MHRLGSGTLVRRLLKRAGGRGGAQGEGVGCYGREGGCSHELSCIFLSCVRFVFVVCNLIGESDISSGSRALCEGGAAPQGGVAPQGVACGGRGLSKDRQLRLRCEPCLTVHEVKWLALWMVGSCLGSGVSEQEEGGGAAAAH